MQTYRERSGAKAFRLSVTGKVAILGLLLAVCVAHAAPRPQENPNRPPWAQKGKPGDATPTKASGKADAEEIAQDRGKIKVNVNLVNVLVSVLDEHNRPATDLPMEAFQILDEEHPQKIAVFEKETQQPLDLALMVDASLSAQLAMPAQREAAAHFIQQVLKPGDRLAVYAFDENVTQLVAFTDNVAHLQDAVRRIPQGAGTSIYDAIYLGSRALVKQGSERRRVIILVTDGGETTSHVDFDSCRREALKTGALLYSVVIRSMKSESGRNTAGEHALETITDTTGGAVFYPESSTQLDGIFEQINQELRTQYRLGYYPNPRGPADTYRKIEVTVTPPAAAVAPARNPDLPVTASDGAQPASATTTVQAQAGKPVYSVRHRKSYYTGLP
jgi:Ca-activated chloride channel homolog